MRRHEAILLVTTLALSVAACSTVDEASPVVVAKGPTGSGGHGGSGQGGSGGGETPRDVVCASSPAPAPFGGTDDCPASLPAKTDTFDAALAAGGLDRCKVHLFPEDVALSGWGDTYLVDKRRLPDFTPLHRGPLRLPNYGRETASWLDAALASTTPVTDTIAALSARRGHVLSDVCVDRTEWAVASSDDAPLAASVLALDAHHGSPGDEAATRALVKRVPIDVQRALAPIVAAIDHAATTVTDALHATTASDRKYLAKTHALYVPAIGSFSTTAASLAKLDGVDLDAIVDASALLAKTIELANLGPLADADFEPIDMATPIGRIVVRGSGDDVVEDKANAQGIALLFDLGGNDTYRVPAGASDEKTPVSVAIDVRGSDHYGYVEVPSPLDGDLLPSDAKGRYDSGVTPDMGFGPITLSRTPRQGSGTAGIGLLFDLGKESDTYRSLAISQGFAAMGVGVLFDEAGDDVYEAEVASQGAAVFGVAALVDRSGNDTRRSFSMSQAFGGAKGAAALVDGSGDDDYLVDVGDPDLGGHPVYFTPQLPGKGNASMSQGAAQGRRPQNAMDTGYMAGGIGVLRDAAGSDHYTGSVFAQGVGYWQGLGMLLDGGSGADVYNAKWYIQGSSAHFALSLFVDEGGDDRYNPDVPPAATSIGLGHDFSASVHLDLGGNDEYHAPGLSLGSGNINGIGCLVNVGGNDHYIIAGDPTLGAGNYSSEAPFGAKRQDAMTVGIFVDVGGKDTYTVGGADRSLDDTTWSYEPEPYPPPQIVTTEHGCGADEATGSVTLP
jgi:hypothetical protein